MTFAEFTVALIDHTLVVDTALALSTAPSVSDPKSSLTYVQAIARGGIGAVVRALAKFPDKSLLHLLTRLSKGLAVNADGYYTLGQGNPLNDSSYDGQEIATSGTDALIDGAVIVVEITFATPAAAAVPPGPSNPFGTSTVWEYAEPDSASSIRRARLLAARHDVPLYSFEVVGKHIYTTGTGVRVTFFPGDFGANATDQIPPELFLVCLAAALSIYYGQKAASSGVGAAQYYHSWMMSYINLLREGSIDAQPLPPYAGT